MSAKWKLFTITSLMAIVGVTAIAFASDLLSHPVSNAVNTGFVTVSQTRDDCPVNACSVVFKAVGVDQDSVVIDMHK
jgi:hypothetical protein